MTFLRFSDLTARDAVRGQRVFIRADLNVPLGATGAISDDTRVRGNLPCIRMALDAGAAVMVASHLGRPDPAWPKAEDSLAPVAAHLTKLLGANVPLVRNWTDGVAVRPGQIVLLENTRLNEGEKNNDEALARKMAALCDIYVNDAFGCAHRTEASTSGIARFAPIACAGPLLASELDAIGSALANPKRPLVAIVGGSKISTKLTVLRSLANVVDQLIVGGGIANTFMLAAGLPIGKSLSEPRLVDEARAVMALMRRHGAAVPVPTDVVTAPAFRADAVATVKRVQDVTADDMILDVGPDTAAALAARMRSAGTIIWNGPLGVFEWDAFTHGTEVLAHAIADSGAFSAAGGGDTVAAIARYGIAERIDYISTGGGAFLEMLEGKTLPAVAVLEERAHGR